MTRTVGQLLSRAQDCRRQARRARRLAHAVSCDATAVQLRRYAERLDITAWGYERGAAAERARALGFADPDESVRQD
ncbi:MAG: hypothetical protein ACOY4R_06320 [Pseudomonadota bacterium]